MKGKWPITIIMDISEAERRESRSHAEAILFAEYSNDKDSDKDGAALHRKIVNLSDRENISYKEAFNVVFEEAADIKKEGNPYEDILNELVGPPSQSFLKNLIWTEKDEERLTVHRDALRLQMIHGGSYRDALLAVLKANKFGIVPEKYKSPEDVILDELVGPFSKSWITDLTMTEKDRQRLEIKEKAGEIKRISGISYRDAVLEVLKEMKQ